jgi:hypothetical protein
VIQRRRNLHSCGGAAVTRAWQLVRTADGTTIAWIGRQKRPGGGEISSGLAFDDLAAVASAIFDHPELGVGLIAEVKGVKTPIRRTRVDFGVCLTAFASSRVGSGLRASGRMLGRGSRSSFRP